MLKVVGSPEDLNDFTYKWLNPLLGEILVFLLKFLCDGVLEYDGYKPFKCKVFHFL